MAKGNTAIINEADLYVPSIEDFQEIEKVNKQIKQSLEISLDE